MKITNTQPTGQTVKPVQIEKKTDTTAVEARKESPAAIYERSEESKKTHGFDKATIDQLKAESEQAHSQLIRLVNELLQKQGKTLSSLAPNESVPVDEATRAKAQQMIGPDGEYGIEAVSDRLVDFAKAISGGDKSKAESLRSAIDQGFKEAERILGGLPEISKQTYQRTMEKFDNWVNGND